MTQEKLIEKVEGLESIIMDLLAILKNSELGEDAIGEISVLEQDALTILND